MTDKERITEMAALLRMIDSPGIWNEDDGRTWEARRDAILDPPPDPDAAAKEIRNIYQRAWMQGDGIQGYRAVAAWSDKRVRDARIAGLREALGIARCTGNGGGVTAIFKLIAKAGAEDA